jgi:hypothetical protein
VHRFRILELSRLFTPERVTARSEERRQREAKMRDMLYDSFRASYEASEEYIREHPELASDFDVMELFAGGTLADCFPCDLESLEKLWPFPITEAAVELEYALFLAKGGIYKVAFMCLRNFLELGLICCHFLLTTKRGGNAWINGAMNTPFKKDMLKVLFENQGFQEMDRRLNLKGAISHLYDQLSDVCHTRGRPSSHATLSASNLPRMVERSLRQFVDRTMDVLDAVIICLVCLNPIILFPLPIEEKFGMNGPMVGFLQEHQVGRLRKLLKPASLKHLLERYEPDPGIIRVREWFEALPNMTEGQLDKQCQDFREWMQRNSQETNEGQGK